MATINVKSGSTYKDIRFDKINTIKQVTETRVIVWENYRGKSATGRNTSTHWMSIKTFNEHIEKGEFVIL